jgi:hypothetical protein
MEKKSSFSSKSTMESKLYEHKIGIKVEQSAKKNPFPTKWEKLLNENEKKVFISIYIICENSPGIGLDRFWH